MCVKSRRHRKRERKKEGGERAKEKRDRKREKKSPRGIGSSRGLNLIPTRLFEPPFRFPLSLSLFSLNLSQGRARITLKVALLTSASDTVLSAKLRTLQWRKAVPPSCTVTFDTVLLSFASFTLCNSSRLLNQRARQSDGMLYGTRRSAERKTIGGRNYIDFIKSTVSGRSRRGETERRRLDYRGEAIVVDVRLAAGERTFSSEQRKIQVRKITRRGTRERETRESEAPPNSACSTSALVN
jgi:hypothetical protein